MTRALYGEVRGTYLVLQGWQQPYRDYTQPWAKPSSHQWMRLPITGFSQALAITSPLMPTW